MWLTAPVTQPKAGMAGGGMHPRGCHISQIVLLQRRQLLPGGSVALWSDLADVCASKKRGEWEVTYPQTPLCYGLSSSAEIPVKEERSGEDGGGVSCDHANSPLAAL